MARRALVTGCGGFVGGVLLRRLAEAGWSIACVDRHLPPGLDGHQADLTIPAEAHAAVEAADGLDCVFHLAGLTFVPQAIEDPSAAMRANFDGTANLLAAVRRHAPAARVIVVSTSEVYGPPVAIPIDETHPLQPNNPYSISKAAADRHSAWYAAREKMDVVIARPFNHSGPGQSDRFVLPAFARQVAMIESGRAPSPMKVGNLSAARDFCHVEDVVAAYLLLAEKGESGEVYNICSGDSHSIQSALEGLLSKSNASIDWEVDPARWRPDSVPEVCGSYAKLSATTGWQPKVAFDDLLDGLLNDWRERVKQHA